MGLEGGNDSFIAAFVWLNYQMNRKIIENVRIRFDKYSFFSWLDNVRQKNERAYDSTDGRP